MVSVVFSVTSKKFEPQKVLDDLKNSSYYKNICVVFACEKSNDLAKNFAELKKNKGTKVSLFTFPNGTKEESMLENVIKNLETSNIIIVRNDCEFYSVFALDELIGKSFSGGEIVMFKSDKKINWFKRMIKKIQQKLCNLFFNFNFYAGDIGMQYFSEQAHSLLKITSPTILTKLNRWVALNVCYIEKNIPKTVIKNKSFDKNNIKSILYICLFVLTLVGAIVLNMFIRINIVFWLLIGFAIVVFFAMTLYTLLNSYTIYTLGNLYVEKVDFVERKDL